MSAIASLTAGFRPADPRDAHLTVGYNQQGFSPAALRSLKGMHDVTLASATAQGLHRKNGNLHLIYSANTRQIAVAIEFPSHQVNEMKAMLRHTFDGKLSLSHMTIGVLDPQVLGVNPDALDQLAKAKEFDALQGRLDEALNHFLMSDAGKPLSFLAQQPIQISMEKVHASPHTECPLDITQHPNPISTRVNALDHLQQSRDQEPDTTAASWVERLLDAGRSADVTSRVNR